MTTINTVVINGKIVTKKFMFLYYYYLNIVIISFNINRLRRMIDDEWSITTCKTFHIQVAYTGGIHYIKAHKVIVVKRSRDKKLLQPEKGTRSLSRTCNIEIRGELCAECTL